MSTAFYRCEACGMLVECGTEKRMYKIGEQLSDVKELFVCEACHAKNSDLAQIQVDLTYRVFVRLGAIVKLLENIATDAEDKHIDAAKRTFYGYRDGGGKPWGWADKDRTP